MELTSNFVFSMWNWSISLATRWTRCWSMFGASAANSPWSGQLVSRGRTVRPWNPDSGHTGTIRITAQLHRTSRNGMKPRIQCALTP
jgi:hypothetical protein